MVTQTVPILIDKDYKPLVGDVLSNEFHPLVIIQTTYSLDRTSLRINRKFYEQEARHNVLQKIIQRKEIIWSQHKFDLRLFPDNTGKDPDRTHWSYWNYLIYNDNKAYARLYVSKYNIYPQRKIKAVTGQKLMVKANHALCVSHEEDGRILPCTYWYGSYSMPLTKLVKDGFLYRGNLYTDFMGTNIVGAQ